MPAVTADNLGSANCRATGPTIQVQDAAAGEPLLVDVSTIEFTQTAT
jgi:hypothetical protein